MNKGKYITAILSVLVIFAVAVFLIGENSRVNNKLSLLEENANDLTAAVNSAYSTLNILLEENNELRSWLAEEEKNRSLAEEYVAESSKKFEDKIDELNKELNIQKKYVASSDITNIIKEWSPRAIRLTCEFKKEGKEIMARGSGIVYRDVTASIITNKHVVSRDSGEELTSCKALFPESGLELTVGKDQVNIDNESDVAYLDISSGTNIPISTLKPLPFCSSVPNLGDQVVILGYPAVGSMTTVTATDGIISGFDDKYYITSAKIEQGNSGGAAILVKDNCFVGIPTLVIRGRLESFARILPAIKK
ncbi:MAG: hypothetical protein A3G52_02465 [Candidatus Taylorbacteria bacterium RIFCSPLOWO2_12_FULL_43_20]|uniref:Serine protease n=1 Tax=Candidatus Taylorbacteria bacterium RIFCSPLOWO2_12_FULL_43_20 TaxID=1802332 RepID=A0A1G2P2Q6_9BACT|nr:MAG: hypothetical protein A2825_00865 [Candidatus Taylorbacteria bacterium RIFCSPHIGHO2_01_FULL_43_120]OHA22207.1 MAG: hypothetical protein A3B98_02595 [Candidatus Taylorbacteria bacterium RIFCSPHIGHO2_02_FULL_43_55]OHA28310.1 MAG: hypothetical protein A3E92_01765 [Candidatus Taylorbacteria bacterium RIFCSPHIGHO2_12_FULL_42_34]OHA30330.1 MAG: hypothetical protein A3B09_03855 [Candidatus Taylorbacteria bacterium RIFCSPLOWO2_01_FULL_43_83]OHA37901.1 MAG: hypothetical protein A3H58_00435 [Candi